MTTLKTHEPVLTADEAPQSPIDGTPVSYTPLDVYKRASLASRIGGKQGLAAILLVIIGVALIVAPTAMLMSSLGDSVHQLVNGVQNMSLKIPAPRPGIEEWPVVGKRIHEIWAKAHADLPALAQSMQPKIGELARASLGFVASIGSGLLQFLAALIIAGILMACLLYTSRCV